MPMHRVIRRHARLTMPGVGLALAAFLASSTHGRSAQMLGPDVQRVAAAPLEPSGRPAWPSLADRQIAAAQRAIEQAPSEVKGYNSLCAAYMHKARETGDFRFNVKAEVALNRSLAAAPDNFDAIKLWAVLLLTYHRFGEALDVARRAQQLRPQDHEVYAAMTDALVELGDYGEAGRAAQRLIDLRPDAASYARVSYLRALHGDTEGAVEAMHLAVQAANPADPEGVAWYRVHLGYELMNAGQPAEAEHEFDVALAAFADYHLALAAKARARLAAGDAAGAVEFYRRAQNRVPLPDTVVALGDLYAKLGREQDAKRQYDLLEFIERAGTPGASTYSRQLAIFWADHDMRLTDALDIARRELAVRSDIYTSDALAWCLFKTGALGEAKAAIDAALRLGTRDARLYYHAGMIAKGRGDNAAAVGYLRRALQTNPVFDVLQAEVARRALTELGS
jgi:tetratricopeptide (TPR) repeat protein